MAASRVVLYGQWGQKKFYRAPFGREKTAAKVALLTEI
jgi:hypothetical protein